MSERDHDPECPYRYHVELWNCPECRELEENKPECPLCGGAYAGFNNFHHRLDCQSGSANQLSNEMQAAHLARSAKDHDFRPANCPGCNAPTHNAAGNLCPDCAAQDPPDDRRKP